MVAYIARRMILALFTIWVISILTFVIIELPEGDAAERTISDLMAGGGVHGHVGNAELLDRLRDYMDLDKPQHVRYMKWIWRMLHGDLGFAYTAGEAAGYQGTIKKIIGDRLWMTVALTSFTIVVTWTFAIPVGIYSAVRQHSHRRLHVHPARIHRPRRARLPAWASCSCISPTPTSTRASAAYSQRPIANADWSVAKLLDLIEHLWIPAVVLGTSGTAGLIRVMRNNLLDELGKPYVVTARAKGVKSAKLIFKYPVRVAINPLISTVGYLLPSLVSGSVIVSVVLSLPTLGPVLLTAIQREDTNVAGFIILMLGDADRHRHPDLGPSPGRRGPHASSSPPSRCPPLLDGRGLG